MVAALLWLLVSAAVVFALPHDVTTRTRECGTYKDPAAIIADEKHFKTALSKIAVGGNVSAAEIAPFPVVWHVIRKSGGIDGGDIPDSMIEANILATNQHYEGTGISFQLYKITRTTNPEWFSSVAPDEQPQTDMKTLLREGNATALNVYTVGFEVGTGMGLLGYATQPVDYQRNPINDGVVILHSSLPGGSTQLYNEGKTLTHEVGHWLGLFHPFQGGCVGDGDFVADTPPQATKTSGCPLYKDSCAGDGVDSIHNYMDYSDDSCLNTFTPGQVTRMTQSILAYRQIAA